MTLKTDKRLMTENEYIVGMLHQIDAKLDEMIAAEKAKPKYIKSFRSAGKGRDPLLRGTKVPGRYDV